MILYLQKTFLFFSTHILVLLVAVPSILLFLLWVSRRTDEEWMQMIQRDTLIEKLSKTIARSHDLVNKILGPRLLSARALLLSFAFSAAAALLFYFILYELWNDAELTAFPDTDSRTFTILDNFRLSRSYRDGGALFSPLTRFSVAVIISFLVDSLSVVETRIILRRITPTARLLKVATAFFADLTLTVVIFTLITPLVQSVIAEWPIVSMLIENRGRFPDTIQASLPFDPPSGYDADDYSYYFLWILNAFSHYTSNLNVVFARVALQLYHWPLVNLEFPLFYNMQVSSSLFLEQGVYYVYPFTVFFLTTFVTSFWSIVFTFVFVGGQLLIKYVLWTRQLLSRITSVRGAIPQLTLVLTFQFLVLVWVIWTLAYFL